MNDRRFILNEPFSEKISEGKFNNILNKRFFHFNENGIVNECPSCSHCNDGFLKLEIPDPKSLKGMIEIERSKNSMKEYLEIHIQKEIENELASIRPEIEEKIRSKYIIKQQNEEASPSVSD